MKAGIESRAYDVVFVDGIATTFGFDSIEDAKEYGYFYEIPFYVIEKHADHIDVGVNYRTNSINYTGIEV